MAIFARGARRRVNDAARRRQAGDFHGAIEILADALTAEPGSVAANAEMARALRLIGDPAGAEDHLRVALREVLDYQLIVELAGVVAEQDRIEEADDLIDAALAMADGNPRLDPGEALLVRAALAAGHGRPQDAVAALDRIVPKRASKQVLDYAARLRAGLEE